MQPEDADSVMDHDADTETWCDECGELGWVGVCQACVNWALAHPPEPVHTRG